MPSLISISDALERKIKGITVKEIRMASHLLNMEKPDEFYDAVIEFIEKK